MKLTIVNYISVVTPVISVFLTGQPQMKGVSPVTGNGPIKPVKSASFCTSVPFCPSCDKCPQCCRRSCCGGQAAKILASLEPNGL